MTTASQIEPPPTYAEVVLVDPRTNKPYFNPIWLKWFIDIAAILTLNTNQYSIFTGGTSTEVLHGGGPTWGPGGVAGPASAVASNLPSFADTTGQVLEDSGIPAGHISAINLAWFGNAITTTIALAKLTPTGTQGSITITAGFVTGYGAPT